MPKKQGIPSSMDEDMVRNIVYDRLRLLDVSQREYAQLGGFDHTGLSRFLNGEKPPPSKLLDFLGLEAVVYYEYK